jgi:site-specific DNA-methyltransferase (adenine-specific)
MKCEGSGWTMHLGDCVEVMATLDPVDHIITDPPYEVEAHTKQRRALKDATQKRGAVNVGEVRRVDATLPFAAISPEERLAVALQCGRLAARWTVAFCQIEAITAWRLNLEAAGLDWIRGGIWRKPDGMPQFTGDRPGMGYECMAIAHPPGRKRWNGGGKHAVWTVNLDHAHGGGGQNEHPTKKPIRLMMELVTDFTDPGETVLDPFTGSGTTGVACLRLGRKFVGVEKDPSYFRLACDRLRAEENGSTLQAARAGQLGLLGGVK